MGGRFDDLLPLGNWYPTGTESPDVSGPIELRLSPKCLIPQCFHPSQGLLDPCICRCSLPEWASPTEERESLFQEPLAQGVTPELVLVRVTPRVWAWVQFVRRAVEARGSQLVPFQREVLFGGFLREYVRKAFPAAEIEREVRALDEHLKGGGHHLDFVPQPDPIWLELRRLGLARPWHGFDEWAERVKHSASPGVPPPPAPPVPPPAAAPAVKAKSKRQADDRPVLF